MPLGKGYTIEEQVTDEAKFGGIQIGVFDASTGSLSRSRPEGSRTAVEGTCSSRGGRETAGRISEGRAGQFMPSTGQEPFQALATPREQRPWRMTSRWASAGGSIRQQILKISDGHHTGDQESFVRLRIRIVSTAMFKRITGRAAPPTPVSAEHYTKAGLPWFGFYNDSMPSLAPSGILARIRGVRKLDRLKGIDVPVEIAAPEINPEQVRQIAVPTRNERVSELRESCKACLRAQGIPLAKRR